MRQIAANFLLQGMPVKPIVMTGEAALMAKCDRRTFKDKAAKMGIEPIGFAKGNKAVYWKSDAEKVARAIIEESKEARSKQK